MISYIAQVETNENRLPLEEEHDAVTDEDIPMSSWTYSDPAPPIFHAYIGESVIVRYRYCCECIYRTFINW